MTDDDIDSPARDLELLRLMRDADRQPFAAPTLPGDRAMVGRVTTTSGMAVGKYLTVNPVRLLGSETEGGTGSLTVQTSASIPVYLVGPGVPATGADLICRRLGHRWAADYDTVFVGPCLGTITVTVLKCGTSPSQNEPIQILSGATVVASGSTNSSGTISFTGRAMGTYTVKYNDASNPQTSSVTLSTCGSTVTASFLRMYRMSAIISSTASCFGPSGSSWSIAGTGSYTASGTIAYNSAAPSGNPIQQNGVWVSWTAGIAGTYTLTVDGVAGATYASGCTPTDLGNPTISGSTANNELCPGYVSTYVWPATITLTMSGTNYTVGAGTYTLYNAGPTSPNHYTGAYSAAGMGGTCSYQITFDAVIPTYCTADPGYGGLLFLGSGVPFGSGFCYGANSGFFPMLPAGPHAACPPFGTLTATGAGYSITITGL